MVAPASTAVISHVLPIYAKSLLKFRLTLRLPEQTFDLSTSLSRHPHAGRRNRRAAAPDS
jgi:hypothetical protein